MGDKLLTSKEILEKTGISRATLNNYIARGFLPKPFVSRPEVSGSGPRQIGHFAPEVLERIELIQQWKRGGVAMEEIALRLAATNPMPLSPVRGAGAGGEREIPLQKSFGGGSSPAAGNSETLTLTVEQLPHIAYMVNYKFEILWLNEKARVCIP